MTIADGVWEANLTHKSCIWSKGDGAISSNSHNAIGYRNALCCTWCQGDAVNAGNA